MANAIRGMAAAAKYHDEHTGLDYNPFRLKDENDFKVVRPLQTQDEWVSLFMHTDFNLKLGSFRCGAEGEEPDMEACIGCAHGVKRSLRTYIPVRVRQDDNQKRVWVIEYGRNGLLEVMNFIEEHCEDVKGGVTGLDVKIKRQGKGTDTKYRWIYTSNNTRPLNDDELALEVPDMDAILGIPDDARVAKLLAKIGVKDDASDGDAADEDLDDSPKSMF
jgi:hypothetical protein